jgi:hypothetical protein
MKFQGNNVYNLRNLEKFWWQKWEILILKMEALRKFIRLAVLLLYIMGRKRHRSIQRKKLYSRMSNVLLNSSILAIYMAFENQAKLVKLYCW